MRMMQTTNGAGIKAGMTALLLAACFMAVFLMGCENPLNMRGSEVAEGGTGTLSLTIDRQGAGRAILPVWPDDFARLRLAFDPRCDAGNDPDYEIWTGDMDSIPPLPLSAGLWYLHVTAYVQHGNTYRAIASGSVLDYFEILPDDEAAAEVTLLPIRLGRGTFSWEIDFPVDVTMARMEIAGADDNGPPIRYYFVGGTPSIDSDSSMELDAGQYRVSITLSGPLGVAGVSTALRVYRYMDSFFEYEFTSGHFLSDPVWDIELSQTEPRVFAPAQVGYSAITPATITVENTGNRPTGELSVTVSVTGTTSPDAFTVTGSPIASIAVGETDTFTVGPILGLAVGIHTATVTVSGGNDISESFGVSFTVTAEPPPPVWAISLDAPATHVFDALIEGYAADDMEALAIIVTNMGNQATGALAVMVTVTGTTDPGAFTVTGSPIASIAVGETGTFTVRPALDLAVGTHTATVTVSGGNDISESFGVSFEVTAEPIHTCVWGDWIVTTPATCTTDGEETRTCTINSAHTQTRPIPALGHDWSEWIVTTAPTCTTDGVETRTCLRAGCDHYETRPGATALGHVWGEWTETTAPTCTVDGVQTRTCQICNTATQTQPIAALGHNWGDWVETTAPTCTTAAVETRTCARCDTQETRAGEPALGHDWGNWIVTTPPTGTQPGVETRTCARSGTTETREIPALGQGTAPFTISWRDFADMAEGAIITAPNVSYFDLRNGTNVYITIREPDDDDVEFANIRWFFGGSEITGGAVSYDGATTLTLTPDQVGFGIGPRNVAVRVYVARDGGATVPYGRVITFSVTL